MRETRLRMPDLMLLVGTRVALGVGIGLLVAKRLDDSARKAAGLSLLAVGVLTTVPILLNVRAGAAEGLAGEGAVSARASMGPESDRRDARAYRDEPRAP